MAHKFDELLEFPCDFTLKVMGVNNDTLELQVLEVVQRLAPGDYAPRTSLSTKGTYKSMTFSVHLTSAEQLENLYSQIGAIEDVRHVL